MDPLSIGVRILTRILENIQTEEICFGWFEMDKTSSPGGTSAKDNSVSNGKGVLTGAFLPFV